MRTRKIDSRVYYSGDGERHLNERFSSYVVGQIVAFEAGAPGIGRVVYRVNRITRDSVYAVEVSNSIRELDPSEVI